MFRADKYFLNRIVLDAGPKYDYIRGGIQKETMVAYLSCLLSAIWHPAAHLLKMRIHFEIVCAKIRFN